jgi:hypothetical protein
MTQALYAHMNNKTIKIKKKKESRQEEQKLPPLRTVSGTGLALSTLPNAMMF